MEYLKYYLKMIAIQKHLVGSVLIAVAAIPLAHVVCCHAQNFQQLRATLNVYAGR